MNAYSAKFVVLLAVGYCAGLIAYNYVVGPGLVKAGFIPDKP